MIERSFPFCYFNIMGNYYEELELLKYKVKEILNNCIGKRNNEETRKEASIQLNRLMCDFNNSKT